MTDLSDFAGRLRAFMSGTGEPVAPVAEADAGRADFHVGPGLIARPEHLGAAGTAPSHLSEAHFNVLALQLFALQFRANEPYRRFCEARGVRPEHISSWAEIPAIPASAFQEMDLTALAPPRRTAVFHSSGTTGHRPSRHFHSVESLALYEASLLAWFAPHGRRAGSGPAGRQETILLTPPPAEAPNSSLVHMLETVRKEFGASCSSYGGRVSSTGAWVLASEDILASLRQAVAAARPVALLGTAFSFVHLLDFLVEKGVRLELAPGSTVMETGGYKGRSRSMTQTELHLHLMEGLGIPADHIVCEYGMTELSSQAYALNVERSTSNVQRSERVFRFPPWARTRVVSPETAFEVGEGESGLIQVFDLANVWSVLAVQTEDVGRRRGPGFELVGRAARAEPRGCSLTA